MISTMKWIQDDGGRIAAGYANSNRDCVCRAIAIATRLPYMEVFDLINREAKHERKPRHYHGWTRSNARTGVAKPTIRRVMATLGWHWTPTMGIGTGCKVHLREDELPMGRLIVSVSKHLVAVIDGTVYDTHDPSRYGNRCVYGYFQLKDN